jgi:hypothetical protein
MTADAKSIVNLTRGTVVCEDAMIADQAPRRTRGLLGRARHARAALELPRGEAAARGIEIGDKLGLVASSTGAGAIEAGRTRRNGRASVDELFGAIMTAHPDRNRRRPNGER